MLPFTCVLQTDPFCFKIGINVSKGEDLVLSANLRRFGMNVQMRTFDLVVSAHMGSLTVEMPKFKSLTAERDHLFLIDNAHAEGDHLIQMKYVQVLLNEPTRHAHALFRPTLRAHSLPLSTTQPNRRSTSTLSR